MTIICPMGRWEPDAQGRLMLAALELFAERGYEQTTVAEIAERAGLTKRTFFRHFGDKREVLFGGGDAFQATFVNALAAAPAPLSPLEAIGVSLQAGGEFLADRHEFARRRHGVIAANPSLQERELVKLAAVGGALAAGLRERGVPEPAASLTAQAGMAVFHVAFERWLSQDDPPPFTALIADSLDELRAVAAH
jgi:AcrR family transcriptional regulator